ncbi:MAG: hypothetical protein LC633_08340 [Desulfobulbaceae bacterium]|nr:hypothetical protein [Desulfobulbaceae bacterium]
MKINLYRILLASLLLALGACAATRLQGAWINTDYQGNGFQKILILGLSENETYRRVFENAMSHGFNQRGISAEPGYTLFPEQRPDQKTIAREISAQGFDAMMISQVTGKNTRQVYYPGETYYLRDPYFMPPLRQRYWYDYYYRSYEIVREPGYVHTYKTVTVQSNIYDTQSEELIWSAVSETVVDGNIESAINSLVDTLIGKLDKMDLLRP